MATTTITTTEEPILSRLDRLDNMLRQLEEIKVSSNRSPKSSCASTPSSGTLTSDGRASSDFSPRSLEKRCRPIDDVIVETEAKGTLIERLVLVEHKVLKLEEELEAEKRIEEKVMMDKKGREKKKKKGLKGLVESFRRSKIKSRRDL